MPILVHIRNKKPSYYIKLVFLKLFLKPPASDNATSQPFLENPDYFQGPLSPLMTLPAEQPPGCSG